MNYQKDIESLNKEFANTTPEEVLKSLSNRFPDEVVFSTSFGLEDQVITDMIAKENLAIRIFTLDTGRLFPETYKTFSRTLERYNKQIEVFYPNTEAIQALVTQKGPYSFYLSQENRKECCYIRKVEPLERALNGSSCWVTGLRSDQSDSRKSLKPFEWDDKFSIIKYNPLLYWTLEDVKEYIHQHNVPYNLLHDKGFISIGCEPCTRAIEPGEDYRAGRWWWENNSKKECGLHTH